MPRPLRPDIADSWYHVMNRGIDRGRVFFSANDRIDFEQRLGDVYESFGVETHAYCLMDTHYHLLLHCPDGKLSPAMQQLGSVFTRHVNDRRGRDGALFRGRFHSVVIDDDAYLVAACRYIHRNALDLPGVADVGAYRWSSHRRYVGDRTAPKWLRTQTVLSVFAGDRSAFDRFVRDSPVAPATGGWSALDLRRLEAAVSMVLAELLSDSGLVRSARTVTLAWADFVGVDRATMSAAFDFDGHRSALRSALSKAKAKMRDAPHLWDVARRATELTFAGQACRPGSDPGRDGQVSAARAAS